MDKSATIVIGSTQANAYIGSARDVSSSLTASMGTGGEHILMVIELYDYTLNTIKSKTMCIGGYYCSSSKEFDRGILHNLSRALKAKMLDACAVLVYSISDER